MKKKLKIPKKGAVVDATTTKTKTTKELKILVDSYNCSSDDILPVDDISVAIAILNGLRSQSTRVIPWVTNRTRFTQDVSKFEISLDEAIGAFEELRFQIVKKGLRSGGSSNIDSQEDPPADEISIAIALLNNAKIRAELSITNPWGQSLLNAGQQETMDNASAAINTAIEILKNSQS